MRFDSKVCWLGIITVLSATAWCAMPGIAQDGKKLPIPNEAAQVKALKLIDDIFQEDFAAAKQPEAKSKLAAYLFQQGKESQADPANRYILYREARDLAASAGDARLALAAADELSRQFEVSALQQKADVMVMIANINLSKEASKDLVELVLPMIQEAIEIDNFPVAIALGKVVDKAAHKSKILALVTAVQKRNEEILAVQKGFARLQAFIDRVEKNPQDAEANLELGKYYAVLKHRWEKALPYLAGSSDAALKPLALDDLARPKDPHRQLALADGWWNLASTEKEPTQLALQRRAIYWYDQALPKLAGLSRTKAQRRIDQVSARLAGTSADMPVGPVGEIKKFEGHTNDVKSVAFSSDGRYGVSGSVDETVRIWDLLSGKQEKVLTGHSKQVWSVAFLPPGNRQILSASWDATVRLWDAKTGSELRRFAHNKDVNGLAVSRDGNTMLSASDDHNVYLWNLNTGEEIRRFSGHSNFAYCVAFAADGKHGASGSVDKTVRVFDLDTGSVVKVFDGQTSAVTNVAFTTDSRAVLSCGDNAAHLWDLASGKELRRFEGHKGNVLCIALSPDGRRLATGGDDKTIRLWDVNSGKQLHVFEGHSDSVNGLAISMDGHRMLSGSLDRTVRLWGLPGRLR